MLHTVDEAWGEVRKAVSVLNSMKIPYVLVGSLAGSTLGAPRTTNDADLLVGPFPGREREFVSHFGAEYYLSLPSIIAANEQRSSFNVINTNIGFKLDFFVQKQAPFHAAVLSRAEIRHVPEGSSDVTKVMSAEDLVLSKLDWYRLGGEVSDRQWKDIIEILEANWPRLDRDYLSKWARDLKVDDLLPIALEQAQRTAGEN